MVPTLFLAEWRNIQFSYSQEILLCRILGSKAISGLLGFQQQHNLNCLTEKKCQNSSIQSQSPYPSWHASKIVLTWYSLTLWWLSSSCELLQVVQLHPGPWIHRNIQLLLFSSIYNCSILLILYSQYCIVWIDLQYNRGLIGLRGFEE